MTKIVVVLSKRLTGGCVSPNKPQSTAVDAVPFTPTPVPSPSPLPPTVDADTDQSNIVALAPARVVH